MNVPMPDWSIVTLLGSITVGAIALAIKFGVDAATAQRARDDALKDLETVRAEKAALQKIVDDNEAAVVQRAPKPLDYPGLNIR
jgi:hypothetical protein